jgi:hypothetical protein
VFVGRRLATRRKRIAGPGPHVSVLTFRRRRLRVTHLAWYRRDPDRIQRPPDRRQGRVHVIGPTMPAGDPAIGTVVGKLVLVRGGQGHEVGPAGSGRRGDQTCFDPRCSTARTGTSWRSTRAIVRWRSRARLHRGAIAASRHRRACTTRDSGTGRRRRGW